MVLCLPPISVPVKKYYGYIEQSEWKVIKQLLFVTCDKFIKSTIRYNDLSMTNNLDITAYFTKISV